jgi:hypothetical protein
MASSRSRAESVGMQERGETTGPDLRCHACGQALAEQDDRCPACGADARVVVLADPAPGSSPRRPHPWRRGLAIGGAAVLLATGLWYAGQRDRPLAATPPAASVPSRTAAPSRFVGGLAPIEFTHGRWFCAGDALAAYIPGGHFFEFNHPLHPDPSVEPAACFPKTVDAQAAGFTEALTPPGTEVALGVFVVTEARLLPACRAASRRLHLTVPCPTKLPTRPRGAAAPDCRESTMGPLSPPCTFGTAFAFDDVGFAAPPAVQCCPTPHLYLIAYRVGSLRGDVDTQAWLTCLRPGTVASLGVGPEFGLGVAEVDVIHCPLDASGVGGGELILRWSHDGEVFQLGVPDVDNGVDLALAILRGVRLVHVGT